jgi:hypothetical protein
VTPVTLVASVFRRRPLLSESELLAELATLRETFRDRPWLLREKTPKEIWKAARQVLELRHLIAPAERWGDALFGEGGAPELEDAWQWNPQEHLLRDYYANALMTFEEVRGRGWPERKPRQ